MKVNKNTMSEFLHDEVTNAQTQANIWANKMYQYERDGAHGKLENARRHWIWWENYWDAACAIYAHYKEAISKE